MVTLLQHWTGAVLHWLCGAGVAVAVVVTVTVVVFPGVVVGEPQGVATARVRREARESVADARTNIVAEVSGGSEELWKAG